MSMSNVTLFLLSTLIWGSTWYAITFQLGHVPGEVSVAYRFAIAAAILIAWCAMTRESLAFTRKQHLAIATQGLLLFGANYILVYWSEVHITSGLLAVLFSLIVFMNLLGAWIFFGTPITRRVFLGAALGVVGVTLLFWPEIHWREERGKQALGLAYGLAATIFACAGNLVAARNQQLGIRVLPGTAWGMAYGAAGVALFALANQASWTFDERPAYIVSLLYLALFGSVFAFVAYLTLLGRIGTGPAGYVGVSVPLVALVFSTLFESYRWSGLAIFGAALCVIGNVLVLMRGGGEKRAPADASN